MVRAIPFPHGVQCDPSLCAGTFRTQAVFTVTAFQIIKVIINEVGIYLHQKSEEKAKQCWCHLEAAVCIGQAHPSKTGVAAPANVLGAGG